MYGDRIRQFQFFQSGEWVIYTSAIIKLYRQCRSGIIDLPYSSHISIEYTQTFIYGNIISADDLPFQLIVIFDLHDLVALTEHCISARMLLFTGIGRIQIPLQNSV